MHAKARLKSFSCDCRVSAFSAKGPRKRLLWHGLHESHRCGRERKTKGVGKDLCEYQEIEQLGSLFFSKLICLCRVLGHAVGVSECERCCKTFLVQKLHWDSLTWTIPQPFLIFWWFIHQLRSLWCSWNKWMFWKRFSLQQLALVNALDQFLAVPQLFLTGLQVLKKIMSIFSHLLSTCVTTALKT